MSYQKKQQYLVTDPRGTEHAKQINARRGIIIICRQTQSAPRHLHQTCTRKVRENTTLTITALPRSSTSGWNGHWSIRREEAVNSIDLLHSSCKAWRTINKLTGRPGRCSRLCHVSTNSIASQLVKNWAHKTGGCESTKPVNKQLSDLWKIPTPEGHSISEPFRPEEFDAALTHLKPGKSPGLDSIFPEFILHTGSALKSWFCDFFNSCTHQLKIPKNWRRALIASIFKLEKLKGDPKSYRPISLLCIPFKILDRLIYARVEAIIDRLLPQEQTGFRHRTSAVDLVTLLTQDTEDSFSAKKKTGAVFVDLIAAYYTIWHRGLTCKLL